MTQPSVAIMCLFLCVHLCTCCDQSLDSQGSDRVSLPQDVVNARQQEADAEAEREAEAAAAAAAAAERQRLQNDTSGVAAVSADALRGWLAGGRTADDGSGLTGGSSGTAVRTAAESVTVPVLA